MAGAIKRIAGPAYLSNSAADIYTPPNAAVYTVINQIHIANVTGGAVSYTLYIGGTAGSTGGTELGKAESISANSHVDLYFSPGIKMISTDFLSGLASAGTSLTITVMGSYQAT
jgi:hypothetical protein